MFLKVNSLVVHSDMFMFGFFFQMRKSPFRSLSKLSPGWL